ncbi:MAG TPA: hypothetical protein VGB85_29700 [Nannocystis sp.]|jgi:hypothetical protein
MTTQTIDIVHNPANPGSEQLLDLPPGGTIVLYGEHADAPLHVRITSLKREGEAEGQFLLEGFIKLPGETTEARVASSFYNARTGRGTLHVEAEFADRYQALAGREPG